MPKFCANLTFLFTEYDFPDRFKAAADAGFKGVEFLSPYDHDKHLLADKLTAHGLTQVLHNLPMGDWDKGWRGFACHPDAIAEFRDSVQLAIEYANALNCPMLHCVAGIAADGATGADLRETLIANLKFAADACARDNIILLTEPINTTDIPGFFLNDTDQAIGIMDAVASDNLKLQYDIYHMQIMEGDLAATIKANLSRIGHIQIADHPGRHEPGTGEINYAFLLPYLDEIGYDGWVGCEYRPKSSTLDGLGWIEAYV